MFSYRNLRKNSHKFFFRKVVFSFRKSIFAVAEIANSLCRGRNYEKVTLWRLKLRRSLCVVAETAKKSPWCGRNSERRSLWGSDDYADPDIVSGMRRQTWYGNLKRHLDEVWPNGAWSLNWSRPVSFWATGEPLESKFVNLGRRYALRRRQKRWLSRQKSLVQQ